MTIKGAQKKLKDNMEDSINNIEVVNRLQEIRKMLLDIKEELWIINDQLGKCC